MQLRLRGKVSFYAGFPAFQFVLCDCLLSAFLSPHFAVRMLAGELEECLSYYQFQMFFLPPRSEPLTGLRKPEAEDLGQHCSSFGWGSCLLSGSLEICLALSSLWSDTV